MKFSCSRCGVAFEIDRFDIGETTRVEFAKDFLEKHDHGDDPSTADAGVRPWEPISPAPFTARALPAFTVDRGGLIYHSNVVPGAAAPAYVQWVPVLLTSTITPAGDQADVAP